MSSALPLLAVLACPIGMGLCMWLMHKGMSRGRDDASANDGQSVEDLRRERERIGAEIARLEDRPREHARS